MQWEGSFPTFFQYQTAFRSRSLVFPFRGYSVISLSFSVLHHQTVFQSTTTYCIRLKGERKVRNLLFPFYFGNNCNTALMGNSKVLIWYRTSNK